MWNNREVPPNPARPKSCGRPNEAEARRKATLVREIEVFIRGVQQREISARDLAAMEGSQRLTTLRKGLLVAVQRAYRMDGARLSILPGLLVLISVYSDNDADGVCTLGTQRIATFLNTTRESVSRAIRQAKDAQLIRGDERPGYSSEYILAMPHALADSSVNIFDMLNVLAPREENILPHGLRRDNGLAIRAARSSANSGGVTAQGADGRSIDTRDAGLTGEGNTRDATVTGVINSCDVTPPTGVIVGSHDLSRDLSVEEEVSSLFGALNFTSFAGAPIEAPEMESEQEVVPSPLPPPSDGYTTKVDTIYADTTHEGWDGSSVSDDVVEALAEVIAWIAPSNRPRDWRPFLDLELARKHLKNVLASAHPTSHHEDRMQALREAVAILRGKLDEADAAVVRGEDVANLGVVTKRIPYLASTFKNRLRQIPIERHKDELSMRNATLKARVDAETEIAIGQKKIAAFSSAVDRNAKAQLKIADSRAAQAGVTRAARGTGRLHGVIACDDGSKTFDPSVRVMTIHRAEIGGSDAIEILQSYEHATTDDVIKALRRVEECDKPQTNGKSGYFDSAARQ